MVTKFENCRFCQSVEGARISGSPGFPAHLPKQHPAIRQPVSRQPLVNIKEIQIIKGWAGYPVFGKKKPDYPAYPARHAR